MENPPASNRWKRAKELFVEAAGLPPEEREAFLANSTADAGVIAEVKSLLAFDAGDDQRVVHALEAVAGDVLTEDSGIERESIGPYRIVRELGRGGMGAVFLAERDDAEFRQRAAIKVVKRGMDTDAVLDRFRHERQILAHLEHPNIARLLDGGTTPDGVPYFVMEYVDGQPVTEFCETRKLDLKSRLRLFITICEAVEHAHRNMVVHRDLKPGNVLVTSEGVPKLLDFGIAKLLTPDSGRETTVLLGRMVTPGYASPEQMRGESVSASSDVYSLGVLLFEMLTGSTPAGLGGRKPSAIAKSLEGDLDNIILMALREEPERRYQSVGDLRVDIRRHLDDLPVNARSDTFRYRSGKFLRRHKLGAVAALLVMVSLIGGIIGTTWQAHRADAARALAVQRLGEAERATALSKAAAETARAAEATARNEQQKAEQADAESQRQTGIAQQRLTNTLEVAHNSLFQITDELAKVNGTEAVRAKVAARTLDYLNLLKAQAGNDPRVLEVLANAYDKLGDVQGSVVMPSLGDTDAAIASYREEEILAARLYRLEPTGPNLVLWWLAADRVASVLGQSRGKRDEAMAIYKTTLAAMEKYHSEKKQPDISMDMGNAHDRVGQLEARPEDAIFHFKREIELVEPTPVNPADPGREELLGAAWAGLGRTYRNLVRFPEAAAAMQKSVDYWELVEARTTQELRFHRYLAIAYSDLGNLRHHAYLPNMGDWRGSLEMYRKSLRIVEADAVAAPANATAQRDLAQVLMSIACRAQDPAMSAERKADLDRAETIAQDLITHDSKAVNYRRLMANILACRADEASFRRGLQEMAASGPLNVAAAMATENSLRNQLAGVLAGSGHSEEAMKLLQDDVEEMDKAMKATPDQDTPRLLQVRSLLTLAEASGSGEAACTSFRRAQDVWDAFGDAKHDVFPADKARVAKDAGLCPAASR